MNIEMIEKLNAGRGDLVVVHLPEGSHYSPLDFRGLIDRLAATGATLLVTAEPLDVRVMNRQQLETLRQQIDAVLKRGVG